MLSAGLSGSYDRVLRFWMQPDRSGEFTVIDPLAQQEFVLVFDVGVDEIAKQSPLNPVIWLGRIVDGAIGHAAPN